MTRKISSRKEIKRHFRETNARYGIEAAMDVLIEDAETLELQKFILQVEGLVDSQGLMRLMIDKKSRKNTEFVKHMLVAKKKVEDRHLNFNIPYYHDGWNAALSVLKSKLNSKGN